MLGVCFQLSFCSQSHSLSQWILYTLILMGLFQYVYCQQPNELQIMPKKHWGHILSPSPLLWFTAACKLTEGHKASTEVGEEKKKRKKFKGASLKVTVRAHNWSLYMGLWSLLEDLEYIWCWKNKTLKAKPKLWKRDLPPLFLRGEKRLSP